MMGPKPEGSCQGLECLNPATETDERGRRLCKACAKYEAEDHHRLNFCPPWLVRTSFGSYPFRCSLTERAMYLLRAVTEDDPKRTPYVVDEFIGWRAALAKELGLVEPPSEAAAYWNRQYEKLPEKMAAMAGVAAHGIAAGIVDKAIAAELRRMADWVGDDDARRVVSARLRARADELDPDYGPCRSCGRTGEGIVCDQCEDEERDA